MSDANVSPLAGFDRQPGFPMSLKPVNGSVRVEFGGTAIVDTDRAMVMDEDGHAPVYYFPRDTVRMDLMTRTDHSTR